MRKQAEFEKEKGMKAFIGNMTRHWYMFLLGLIIFIGLSFVYLKYTTPQYMVSGTLMLKDKKNMPESRAVTTFATDNGLSSLLQPSENVVNEMKVLMSRRLALEVVKKLNLNVKIGVKKNLRFEEIYDLAPFDVIISDVRTDSIKSREFELEFLDNNTVRIINESENLQEDMKVSEAMPTTQYSLSVNITNNNFPTGKRYIVIINSESSAVSELLGNYNVELTDKAATTVNLQLFYPHPKRGELILETLMNQYINDNKEDKIRLADSMLVFIDDRLSLVANELNDVEKDLESFRSQNRITDLGEQSKMLVGNANDYQNRLQDQRAQLKLVNELENYVKDPNNVRVPSSMMINNTSFSNSLNQYNSLIQEYEKKELSYTPSNPVVKNLQAQIDSERGNLLQNISSYKRELQVANADIVQLNRGFNSQIGQVPLKERQFMSYSRQQELKQQLYVYLLQKREEATIVRSSNAQLANIVDNAKSTSGPVKPIPSIIYLMGTLMGLIVPFGFLNAKELMRTKLNSELDIERYTDVEIIGKIGHNSSKEKLSIGQGLNNTSVAEGFRSLRANLYYALQSKDSKVVMVTSTIKGEGKTYMSLNLGNALSMAGKKVLFVELDLRKPKLASMMGIREKINGFSDVIQGNVALEDCLVPCPFNANCDLLTAGSQTDNPSELLLHEKVGELFEKLKSDYDYIIVDSPPVGLVSDGFLIQQYVDMTMYVCRHNYTKKEQFEFVNELKRKNKLVDMYLVVNDVDLNSADYFTYGYGYGYDTETHMGNSWLRRLKS